MLRFLCYSFRARSYIHCTSLQMHSIENNKLQIIKNNSWQVLISCSGTGAPSSGILLKKGIQFYVDGSVSRWPILIIAEGDAIQSSLFIILQVHFTCFRCQPHLSSAVHETVTTASGSGYIFCAAASLQRGQASFTTTGGYSYIFMYSWWRVWLTPETCRVNLQNNK